MDKLNDATDPFGNDNYEPLSLSDADKILYGDLPKSDKRVIPTVDISQLKADITQPRRAVPTSVRGMWGGLAQDVPGLLRRWAIKAEEELETPIALRAILHGNHDGLDIDPITQPIADKFVSLAKLAAGIHRDGLINPIQIEKSGQGGTIIMGERRWLAFHLLREHVDGELYARIPAEDKKRDVWKQAQENGNRHPLNAIEMARQLALLIMDMYKDDDGVSFDTFDTLVNAGGCDRPFYAQVADGNMFQIKRGFMGHILIATGLKSRQQVGQYRDLLNLPDHEWNNADEGNWREFRCRLILHPQTRTVKPPSPTVENEDDWTVENGDMSTVVDISPSPADENETLTPFVSHIKRNVSPEPSATNEGDLQVGQGRSYRYETDDEWEQPQRRIIDDGQIPLSAVTERKQTLWVLNNLADVFAYQFELKQEAKALQFLRSITGEYIREQVQAGNVTFVNDVFEMTNAAMETIWSRCLDAIAELFNDMGTILDKEIEKLEGEE